MVPAKEDSCILIIGALSILARFRGQRSHTGHLYYLSRLIVKVEYLVAFSWQLFTPSVGARIHALRRGPYSRLSGPGGCEPMKSPNLLANSFK